MTDAVELVEIRIVGLPMDVYRETSEHTDELMREFALIREREADRDGGHQIPGRLLELVDQLGQEYRDFTGPQEAQLREAVEAGRPAIDLVYRVPASVRQACLELASMLDEADEFCREGQELLTLATPPRGVAFRAWFLDQFVRQIDGHAPTLWTDPTR